MKGRYLRYRCLKLSDVDISLAACLVTQDLFQDFAYEPECLMLKVPDVKKDTYLI